MRKNRSYQGDQSDKTGVSIYGWARRDYEMVSKRERQNGYISTA
jgi:hypothetical protein